MAVAKKPPEENLIKELISEYPNLSDNQPCGWFVYNNDASDFIMHSKYACHALMQTDPPGFDNLITSAPVKTELALRYYDYLARGPFRAYQDKISVEKLDDEYFIRCTELDKWPSNVIYNFCIATRAPFEKDHILDRWKTMTNAGIDENLAFAIAPFRYNGLDKPVKTPAGYPSHFWFDPAASIRNLVDGTFDDTHVSGKSYKDSTATVRPTNCIWGLSTPAERAMVAGKTPIELCDVFSVPLNPPKPKRVRKPKVANPCVEVALNPDDVVVNNPIFPGNNANWNIVVQDGNHIIDFEVNNNWGNNVVQGED